MRYSFIVNPTAGAGKSGREFENVKALMDGRGAEYDYVMTEYPGHASELARVAAEKADTVVVAVGGDGTLKEVASGLFGIGSTMAAFAFGTGNDLAKALKLPTEPAECVDMLLKGVTRRMDAGLLDGKLFINVAGFGFDVDVLINTEQYKQRYSGIVPYMMGLIKGLASLRGYTVGYERDGRAESVSAVLVAVGNGTHFGGGMKVCPEADPYDGLFDVCIIEDVPVMKLLPLLPSFVKGKHITKKGVRYFKADRLSVACPDVPSVELDGEVIAHTPAEFVMCREALEIIVKE